VCQALYRLCRESRDPLFPTLNKTNDLFLHLRFICQSFVTTLSSYIFDSAIRTHFDPFLEDVRGHAKLLKSSPHQASSQTQRERSTRFADVFGLAEYHANVLDNILFDCLLRSEQNVARTLIQRCLELVLDLGLLGCRVRSEELEEYQAMPELERIYNDFTRLRARLVSHSCQPACSGCRLNSEQVLVLKGIVDQGKAPSSDVGRTALNYSVLRDLLLRLGGDVSSDHPF
jgi:hypothetical protein